jgi:hypothetical protein
MRHNPNSQPHSHPSLQAQLDATLARVVSDKRFMREMDKLSRESVRLAIANRTV